MNSFLLTLAHIASDEEFKNRISIACYIVAFDITNEDNAMSNPVRFRLSQFILQQNRIAQERLSSMIVAHPLVQQIEPITHEDISDKLICQIVLQMWNSMAGINE